MTPLHLAANGAVGVLVFVAFRWIHRRSPAAGAIVAGGILARALVGISLFWISYLNLPLLRSLQLGGGFWTVMVDAQFYYDQAVEAIDQGLQTVQPGDASPFFLKTLAVWMHIVGRGAVAGLLLNLCLYVASCALITRLFRPVGDWRRDLPLLATVGAISFSPVLLIHATQPLKEDVFLVLVVATCVGGMLLLQSVVSGALRGDRLRFAAALGLLAPACYAIAGIRAYYPVIVCGSLAVVLAGVVALLPRPRRLPAAVAGMLALSVMWLAYWSGAGPYYRPSPQEQQRLLDALPWRPSKSMSDMLAAAGSSVEGARTGFARTGGGTNLAERPRPELGVDDTRPPGGRLKLMVIGVGVVFVPISVLKSLSIVNFEGGRGLLPIADADTLFMDVTLAAVLFMLYRRRHLIGNRRAFVTFAFALAAITALLLGYVVTNFGTLFRMRYLVAVPLWLLSLAVPPHRASELAPEAATQPATRTWT